MIINFFCRERRRF